MIAMYPSLLTACRSFTLHPVTTRMLQLNVQALYEPEFPTVSSDADVSAQGTQAGRIRYGYGSAAAAGAAAGRRIARGGGMTV